MATQELSPPKTSDIYETQDGLPKRFDEPHLFKGYGTKQQHPMYKTSNNEYGNRGPTVHDVSTRFFPKSMKFSEHLGECGMYRNCGLNTSMDQKPV
ncbi:piercer of microtubule wall 1 protein-like [Convolutriloba macropyga]|uniref:piercer of microtubule wall 1 protein-like n=1 Tax=Convolutriloba macropyga TaxID=536237 RepID=UPI003F525B8D